jgi:hypothetical protein
LAVVKAADVSSCRKYPVAPADAVQLTVKLPEAEVAGTVMEAGGLGATIW